MNTQFLKGNLDKLKGNLKQKYAQLTDNDLMYVKGKEEELLGNIQKKLGKTKEAVEIVQAIIKEHGGKTEKKSEKKS